MELQHQTRQRILTAVGVAIVLALLALLALSGGNLDLLKSVFSEDLSNEELRDRLQGFGWRGDFVMIALSSLQVTCTVLPAEPIQVLSGLTFGFSIGFLCCMLGVLVGNTVIFLLQKSYGDKLRSVFVRKLDLNLEKIALSEKAVLIIFVLYFLPVIPYGMICFFAASMGMTYKRYIIVTAIGSLPSVCIGVGLGSIAIAANWVVTACVFALFLLLVAFVLCKKNAIITWLNNLADSMKKHNKGSVQRVNTFFMNVLYFGVRVYLMLCGVKIRSVNKIGKPESPSIVLCNHGSFIDFIYAAALLRRHKPHFIVARLYFYHTVLGWLLRKVGAFPKSMFTMDVENAKNCLTVLKNKEILAMMPEARLSTTGRFEDIQESTYSFIKKSGVNVYTIKISGDYLADPKWGKGLRRGAVVETELDILYTAEQIKKLSLEELKTGVEQRLFYNEFEWLQKRPDIRYKSGRMAEGLENILTTCPLCGKKYTLTAKKDKLFCEHCGYLTSLDNRYTFTEGFRFKNLAEWYDWQKTLLNKEIAENKDYNLTSEVELRLSGDGKSLTRHGGYGVCTLNRDGLTYSGTKDKEAIKLHFPMQRIYRLLFGAGENFEIYDGTQILYFVPKERRSAVEWYMASMILRDEISDT